MRIVLDCERMKYPNTGLNTFCSQLSVAMEKVIAKDDELLYFVSPKNEGFMGEDRVYIKQHNYNKIFPVHVPKLDIWHTTYQRSKYSGGSFYTKTVLTVHDLNYLYERNTDIVKYTKRHQRVLDKADHIVAISEYVKNDILQHLKTRGKPISVVHNGYGIAEFPDFDKPGYKPEREFIAAIGTVVRKKNFHVLPALLLDNEYELIIGGTISEYADEIRDYAKKIGVEDRVKIIGAVSLEEKYWYMKNCVAFAFPSIAEGFGLPVLEAMHFGKPVFLSSLTSLPEVGGERAYYFDNFDADHMREIFKNGMQDYIDNKRKEQIIRHAGTFSWEKSAQEYYNIYKSLLR